MGQAPTIRLQNVCIGLCPNPLHFLVLIQENEAKEDQGSTHQADPLRVQIGRAHV